MSFGKSSNSSQQQAQSTSTQTLDPQIKAALLQNYQNAQTLNTPYQPYTGEQVAPLNAVQQQAQQGVLNIANDNVGAAALNNAVDTTQNVANYTPQTVQPTAYAAATGTAASAGPAAQDAAAQIDPTDVTSVTAPTVGADQINQFLNPYTSDVVNTTNADLTRQQQIQQQLNAAQATQAGAFGGSGSAIMDSQTVDSYARQMAEQDAQLQSAGYTTALTAAQQQAAQQLQAQQSNQSTDLAAGTTNAGLTQQTGLANQAATNDQNQFNTGQTNTFNLANLNATNAASAANAGAANTANLANQSAGLAGANLNLAAGAQEGTLSAQQLSQALGLQQAVANVGSQDQAQQQAQDTAAMTQYQNAQNWPLLLQQLMNQSLGLAADPTLTNAQSTSSGDASGSSLSLSSK